MGSEVPYIICYILMACLAFFMNLSWYKGFKKMNEGWSDLYNKLNAEWVEICRKILEEKYND